MATKRSLPPWFQKTTRHIRIIRDNTLPPSMDTTGSQQEFTDDATSETRMPEPPRSLRDRHPLAFGAAVGLGGVSIVAIVLFIVIAAVRRQPQLTSAVYEAAAARWDANGPASYDLDLELTGRRPGKIHVEVRDGEITHMVRDGVEPKQKRTWYYWSVPGQFDTIEQELEMAKDPVVSYGAPSAESVVLWAKFDPQFGFPRQFDRIVMGADLEIHWKVTHFEALDEKNAAASGGAPER